MDWFSFCVEMFRAGENILQLVLTWHCHSCLLCCSQAEQVSGLDADLAGQWRCWGQRGPGPRLGTAGS